MDLVGISRGASIGYRVGRPGATRAAGNVWTRRKPAEFRAKSMATDRADRRRAVRLLGESG